MSQKSPNPDLDKDLSSNDVEVVKITRNWLKEWVIGLNLCPFAKAELVKNRIRFAITQAQNEEDLLSALRDEFEILDAQAGIETTLLIHPQCLADFYQYNQFLTRAEQLLSDLDLAGIYQLASFHPNYQFAGTAPDDVENYTNRSPYPLLHILRETSLDRVLEHYPEPERIPEQNIERLNAMEEKEIYSLLGKSFDEDE